MKLSEDTYVPALRWRQGEYQALLRLSTPVKERIQPLITIPPIEFDFEHRRLKKSVHDHVTPFVSRYRTKWGNRYAWIALDNSISPGRMNDGSHVFDFVFSELRSSDSFAIPALSLNADSDTMNAVAQAIVHDGLGAAVILRIEDLMQANPRNAILKFAASLNLDLDSMDVIVDLHAPNFEPYAAFANALVLALHNLGILHEVRTLVVLGTAIPSSFANVAKGSDELPRHDWLFFQTLLKTLPVGMRRPLYGDHTVVHPEFTAMDMRKITPAGKILYTAPGIWGTRKGGSFRDNPAQMHDHCSAILAEPEFAFRGSSFSYGDKYISDCAVKAEGASNMTRWKGVAINHHITTVADDLANLYGKPWPP